MRRSSTIRAVLFAGALIAPALPALAQTPPAGVISPSANDDPAALDVIEPDYSLINLPTTLRLPVVGMDFHLTHRFNGNLRQGDFGTQFQNLFGIDQGANVGLEFRIGVMRGLEAVAQRTTIGKTIQFSAKYDAIHQNDRWPVSASGIVSIEGDNNFHNSDTANANFAPALGLVVSRKINKAVAFYLEPFWVHNTAPSGPTRDTGFLGIGARVRVLPTVYLMGEVSPRVGGYIVQEDPEFAFAIEKRVGGHVFALTFTNTPATTFRRIAQGGRPDTLNLGFNLTRKFF